MNESTPSFPDDIDVAIVSHNGRETLPRVLACLTDARVPADHISLFDIASTDDTRSWCATAHPRIGVHRLEVNAGPNPARNMAIARATRRYLLLLDSDAYVTPDAIVLLRDAIGGSGVGAVVPVVVHDDRPDRIQYASGDLHYICEAIGALHDRPLAERGENLRDIGTAPGLCVLIDVKVAAALGGFDDRYFMGKEDGEFCYRLRLSGARLVEEPRAVVRHASRPRSTWLFPYQIRNRWHFMLKNYELRTLLVLLPALAIHEPLQLALLTARGHTRDWFRALGWLAPWLRSLAVDRRRVGAIRRVHDRDLLKVAPLVMRTDLSGGGGLKRAYDTWLRVYWALAQRLLP